MPCVYEFFEVCFVAPVGAASIFPFKDFISALALLIIIYTISDVRYHFRVAVAPAPLLEIAYGLIIFIGCGTLLTDLWISEKWPVPNSWLTAAMWQGTMAALFLGLVLTWMFYAFLRPAIYGPRNFKKYAHALYRLILKGADGELPIIAFELTRSAEILVEYASNVDDSKRAQKPSPEGYANDMLLLIANRKFCRHLVASSPVTVIRVLDAAAKVREKRVVPIGPFAKNISEEAIRNTDSNLYHESDWFESGLLGHIKPFSKSLYGNFELIEALGHNSPLDTHYQVRDSWNAKQFETYCNAVLMAFQSYLDGKHWGSSCYTINGAIHKIQEITSSAISDMRKRPEEPVGDAWQRARAGVRFLSEMVGKIEKLGPVPKARTLRIRGHGTFHQEDIYDRIADAMFEIIHSAAYATGTPDEVWGVHYGSVWGDFFSRLGNGGKASAIVRHKVRRLLYDEIKRFESFPNYKSARVLGICLNVMGLTPRKRSKDEREDSALKAVLLPWVKKNYKGIRAANPKIGDACLVGGISYDEAGSRLVKTYSAGLKPEPDREYLPLDEPRPLVQ